MSTHSLPGSAGIDIPSALAYDEAAERSVLGAILSAACLDRDAGWRILDRVLLTGLLPGMFFLRSHGETFATLVAMGLAEIPLDPISVAHELERTSATAFTRGRLYELAREVTASGTAEHHARIVRELWAHRTASEV